MDTTNAQTNVLKEQSYETEGPVKELNELQLALVGGGIGSVIVG